MVPSNPPQTVGEPIEILVRSITGKALIATVRLAELEHVPSLITNVYKPPFTAVELEVTVGD